MEKFTSFLLGMPFLALVSKRFDLEINIFDTFSILRR